MRIALSIDIITTPTSLALLSLGFYKLISPLFFMVPMCIIGGINKGAWMGYTNYTIDIIDEESRLVYFVLTSLITFPTTFLPYIAGIIADAWGFIPLFIINIVAAAIAINLALTLKTPSEIK